MNVKNFALALLLAFAGGHAGAMEPDDEDIGYMLNSTSHGYGYDKEAHKSCVMKGQKNSASTQTLEA